MTLQFTAAVPNNGIFNASAAGQFAVTWMQNDTWTEGVGIPMAPDNKGITFNSLPTFLSANDQPLGTFSFDGSTAGRTSYSLTLASGLADDLAAGGPTSFLLAAADATMSGLFNSRSFKTVASRPVLAIDAVANPQVWNDNGDGNYSDGANWFPSIPNGMGMVAAFGGGASTTINVTQLGGDD